MKRDALRRRAGIILALLLLLFFVLGFLWPGRVGPCPPEPAANGFADFRRLHDLLVTDPTQPFSVSRSFRAESMRDRELDQLLDACAEARARLTAALAKRWSLPCDSSATNINGSSIGWVSDGQCAVAVYLLLEAESVRHSRRGEPDAALDAALTLVDFGQKYGQGSVIYALNGTECMIAGCQRVETLAPFLSPEARREALRRLAESPSHDLDAAGVIQAQRRQMRREDGVFEEFRFMWEQRSFTAMRDMRAAIQRRIDAAASERASALEALRALNDKAVAGAQAEEK